MAEQVKDWLLKQRLQNYGYSRRWFGKMTSQKAQLKRKLRNMDDAEIRRQLALAGILGRGKRLTRTNKGVDYTTGQSHNEEVINMMMLGASKGKRNFWKTQERWAERGGYD